jgi:diaminohydroxyphosphoribosylaminopyrimidine deaminase / 5-amino-6-(5-phosphoribosylamino)uracil reductase
MKTQSMDIKPGDMCSPLQAQELALKEAMHGAGYVAPNPLVGCTLVSNEGKLLSVGYHAKVGEAHAEIDAINKAPVHFLKGATAYVTLEPCSHQGRTPPCADRLIQEGIQKVVIGVKDPNPLVSGKGIERLKKAGIEVVVDETFAAPSRRLAEQFLWNMKEQKPFISLKLATSLDGKMALPNGESKWITSPSSRLRARHLRAHYDATLIGANTLLNDNPMLDFRDTEFEGIKKNKIFVWDPKQKTKDFLPQSEIVKTHGRDQVFVIEDLTEQLLIDLYKKGITSLYVEGGPSTIAYFIKNNLFNKLYCFVAPVILGQGLGWSESLSIASMTERQELLFSSTENIENDLFITAYPKSALTL